MKGFSSLKKTESEYESCFAEKSRCVFSRPENCNFDSGKPTLLKKSQISIYGCSTLYDNPQQHSVHCNQTESSIKYIIAIRVLEIITCISF